MVDRDSLLPAVPVGKENAVGLTSSQAGGLSHLKSTVPDMVTAISVTAVTSKRISILLCIGPPVLPQARRPHCTTGN